MTQQDKQNQQPGQQQDKQQRQGRPDDAGERLALAASSFENAGSAFRAPWTLPARALPVVGHQAAALSELA